MRQTGRVTAVTLRDVVRGPVERNLLVEPYREHAPFLHERGDRTEGVSRRGRVVEDADREDDVEARRLEWEAEEIRLGDERLRVAREVPLRAQDGEREVDAERDPSPARDHVREAARPHAHVEHDLAADVLGRETRLGGERLLRLALEPRVELRRPVAP